MYKYRKEDESNQGSSRFSGVYKYLNIIIILIFFNIIDDNNLFKNYDVNKLKKDIIFYINNFFKKYNILGAVNKIKNFMEDMFLSSDDENDENDENDYDISNDSDYTDNISCEELDKISAINGIFENIHSKNITVQNIYNNKIKTNNIAAKKGTYKNIDSINITTQNIYNKNIKSKSGNISKLKSTNIVTNNLESNNIKTQNFNIDNTLTSKNIETDNLDVILAKSKDLISENIKCTNFDLDNGNFNKLVGDQIDAKEINIISDRRKKKNIKYNPISSDKLDDINVVSFEYKGENENHIGFIAQEIEELYPQLVKKDEHGYLSVKYLEIIPLLIDYNKNLKKKIIDIEEKINL